MTATPRKHRLKWTALALLLSGTASLSLTPSAFAAPAKSASSVIAPDSGSVPNTVSGTLVPDRNHHDDDSRASERRDTANLAKFKKQEERNRREARKISFSSETNMDQAEKTYPFLREDFATTRDLQKKLSQAKKKDGNNGFSNPPPVIKIAENKDEKSKTNVLVVGNISALSCGSRGCSTSIYVDQNGAGYKKAMDALSSGDVYVARDGKDVSLFLGDPSDINVSEWKLKDGAFVQNKGLKTPGGTPIDPKGAELAYGPNWEKIIQDYEKRRDDFNANKKRRLQASQPISFSEEVDSQKLSQAYPFMQSGLAETVNVEVIGTKHAVLPHYKVAQTDGPVKFIFLYTTYTSEGKSVCAASGCLVRVYMNDGAGFSLAQKFSYTGDLSVSNEGGVTSVFVPGKSGGMEEWQVKDHNLVQLNPPNPPG